jgi:hypothetical protein
MIAMALIVLPDLGNLLPADWMLVRGGSEISAQWVAWLCLQQLSMAGLALSMMIGRMPRYIAGAAVLWYMVQALDELVAGNFFHSGLWEYPILVAWFGSILYFLRHERTSA